MSDQPQTEATKELERHYLSAPCPGVEGKFSYFRPGWWMGNPRLQVFLNHPDYPKRDGIITAAFDPSTFLELLRQFEALVEDRVTGIHVENYRQHKDTKERYLDSTLRAKRDEEGVIAVTILKADLPKVAFRFLPTHWHVFKDDNGNSFSKKYMSNVAVLGWVTACRNKSIEEMMREKAPYVPKNGGQSGNGGYSKRNQSSDSMFDDV